MNDPSYVWTTQICEERDLVLIWYLISDPHKDLHQDRVKDKFETVSKMILTKRKAVCNRIWEALLMAVCMFNVSRQDIFWFSYHFLMRGSKTPILIKKPQMDGRNLNAVVSISSIGFLVSSVVKLSCSNGLMFMVLKAICSCIIRSLWNWN